MPHLSWISRIVAARTPAPAVADTAAVSTDARQTDVLAAATATEEAGHNPVATKNRAAAPGGADHHRPLSASSPVFGGRNAAEPKVPFGETTRVTWTDDLRPLPDEIPGFSDADDAALSAELIVKRRGRLVGASYSMLEGTTLTVATDDGELRSVDADHVRVERLARAGTRVSWPDDLRPMPDSVPGLSGDLDPAWEASLIVTRRGVIVGTSDGFLAGKTMTVACDDGRVRTVDADTVRVEHD